MRAVGSGRRETVGERLYRLRLERGLSQRELAEPGVSYAYISRIEAGARQPSVKALRKLARKLAVSVEYLETGFDLRESERRELQLAEAELALRLGDAAEAEAMLRRLAREAMRAKDGPAAARALLALALVADERGEHAIAVQLFEEAFAFERPSPLDRTDVYPTLGRAYRALGNNQREIALYRWCLDEVGRTSPEHRAAQTRYRIWLSYGLSHAGELEQAEKVLCEALKDASDEDGPYTRTRVYWSLARLAEMEGRSLAALRHARRAIALLEATEDDLHRARAHLLAAWILNSAGNAKDANVELERSERLFGDAARSDDVARVKVEWARACVLMEDGAGATQCAREAIDLLGNQHAPILGTALAALGEGLGLQGEIEAADQAFKRGVALLEKANRWRDAHDACRAWAALLRRAGREQAAAVVERQAAFAAKLPHAGERSRREATAGSRG